MVDAITTGRGPSLLVQSEGPLRPLCNYFTGLCIGGLNVNINREAGGECYLGHQGLCRGALKVTSVERGQSYIYRRRRLSFNV